MFNGIDFIKGAQEDFGYKSICLGEFRGLIDVVDENLIFPQQDVYIFSQFWESGLIKGVKEKG